MQTAAFTLTDLDLLPTFFLLNRRHIPISHVTSADVDLGPLIFCILIIYCNSNFTSIILHAKCNFYLS